jgi:hypothetical protein
MEKTQIPTIVTKCVNWIESKGKILSRFVLEMLSHYCSRLISSAIASPIQSRNVPLLTLSALSAEGIYRISASKVALEKAKAQIDLGEDLDWEALDNVKDSPIVAGLLKTYLRCLPEPLFTYP